MEKVKCNICCRTYHTPCLLDNLGKSCVAALAWNPCLWWFCLECLWVTEQANGAAGTGTGTGTGTGAGTGTDTRRVEKIGNILNVSDESNCSSSDSSCDLMDYYRAIHGHQDYPKNSSENRMRPDFDNVKEGAFRSTFAAKSASKTQSPRKLSSASAQSESSESELSVLGVPKGNNEVPSSLGPSASVRTKSSERPRTLISEETRKELLSKTTPPVMQSHEQRQVKRDLEVELYRKMYTEYLNSNKSKPPQRPRMLISEDTRKELLSKTTPPVRKPPRRELCEDVRQFSKTKLRATQYPPQNSSSSPNHLHEEKSPARREISAESKPSAKNAQLSKSSDRSPRNLSSSSGFSESSGSSPAQQISPKTFPDNQADMTPKCSKKIGKTKNMNAGVSEKLPVRSVNIPDIPRVLTAKSIEVAKARALSPTKFEQRQRNADDLNEIRNLVQRGRNFV